MPGRGAGLSLDEQFALREFAGASSAGVPVGSTTPARRWRGRERGDREKNGTHD
jgi:hypothetical protein